MNMKCFFYVFCLMSNFMPAMDRIAIISQTLKMCQQEAEQLSKKIYLGKFQNSTGTDVVATFESPNGLKSIQLKADDPKSQILTIYHLNNLIKLTQLKGKPDYIGGVNFQISNNGHPYKQMSLSSFDLYLSLSYSENKFFAASFFCSQNYSKLDLNMVNTPHGIIIDGTIAGDYFSQSKVECRAVKNELLELK